MLYSLLNINKDNYINKYYKKPIIDLYYLYRNIGGTILTFTNINKNTTTTSVTLNLTAYSDYVNITKNNIVVFVDGLLTTDGTGSYDGGIDYTWSYTPSTGKLKITCSSHSTFYTTKQVKAIVAIVKDI